MEAGASNFADLGDVSISSTDTTDDTASFDDIRFMRSGDPDVTSGGMTFKAATGTTTRFIGWGGNTSFPTPRLMGNTSGNYIGWDTSDRMILQNTSAAGFMISTTSTSMVGVLRFGSTDYIQNDFGRTVLQIGSTNSATAWVKLDCGSQARVAAEGAGANLDLKLDPKGTGNVLIDNGSIEFTVDGEGIEDSSNQELLVFNKTSSAVNHVAITNNTTGNKPKIAAEGDDTNINLEIGGKGTGEVIVDQTSSGVTTDAMRLVNNTGSVVDTGVSLVFQPNDESSRVASIRSIQETSGNYANLEFWTANSDTPALAGKFATNKTLELENGVSFDGGTNVLDEYEEGTWTPTLLGSTTAGSHTYSTQSGTYTRTGRVVICNFYISISTKDGTMAGDIRVGGLPFTSSAGSGHRTAAAFSYILQFAFNDMVVGRVISNVTYARLEDVTQGTTGTTLTITDADVGTTPSLQGTITYETTA